MTSIDAITLAVLRESGEPVREAPLYERVVARGIQTNPTAFIGTLERLATEGHLRVSFERDSTARDPEPFESRFWSAVGDD